MESVTGVAAPGEGGRVDSRNRAAEAAATGAVCHLIASNFLGGPEKQILEHCARLEAAGWRAAVASFRENRDRVAVTEAARSRGLSTFLIDTRSPFSLRAVTQLRARLRREGVSVLVTHGYKANLVGYLATRTGGVSQVPYVRGYTAETRRIRGYEILDRWLLRRFPRVLCVSHRTRDMLAAAGIPASRIRTVHNAVRDPGPVAPSPLRAELGLPEASRLVVAAGRLSEEKGHRFLIEALPLLAGNDAAHLALCGEGREREALERLAAELGVSGQVHFMGFRTDLPGCLSAADVVVNPSLTEGLPNVVLEAMVLGVPVVATDVGGVAEMVVPGETGWLVPPGDAEALARAMSEALGHPETAGAQARRGQDLMRRYFSPELQLDRLLEVYREALRA